MKLYMSSTMYELLISFASVWHGSCRTFQNMCIWNTQT